MEQTEAAPLAQRNVWIDCLRAFCIFAVICTHGLFKFPATGASARWFASAVIDKGYFGVATFFVISGFLIMSNTLRRYGAPAKIDFGQFYAMRAARILPCLLLFIAIMVPLGYSGLALFNPPSKAQLWGSVYAALTFQYNTYYFSANGPGLAHWSPLWSLSIEEMFYLTFPLACFLTRRDTVLAALLFGLILGGPFARGEFAGVFSFWGAADLLAMGGLAAVVTTRFRPQISHLTWPLRIAGGLVILYVFLFCQVRENFALTPTLLGLGTAAFLMGATYARPVEPPRGMVGLVAGLGRVSYEIYVFHVALIMVLKPVGLALMAMVGASDFVAQLSTSLLLLAVLYWCGATLSRLFTEPLNLAIRRFYAR